MFETNPKQDVPNATFGSSQKIWQSKADFDAKVPPVIKAIADVKGKIKDAASAEDGFRHGQCQMRAIATRLIASS